MSTMLARSWGDPPPQATLPRSHFGRKQRREGRHVMKGVWEERFRKRFGFLRKHLKRVMVHFLECGDIHAGFARVRCGESGNEYLLA